MNRKTRKRPRKARRKRSGKKPKRLYPWTPVPRSLALLRSPSQLATQLAPDLAAESEEESEPEEQGLKRRQRLLTKAERDPASILDDKRCLSPRFLTAFFDLCDGKTLERPRAAPAYARVALELAKKTGVTHWRNLARGVAVHARIANSRWKAAAGLLDEYRPSAFGCCRVCASDWFRRQGDLLTESEDPERARVFLQMSAHVLGSELDDDTRPHPLRARHRLVLPRLSRACPDRRRGGAGPAVARPVAELLPGRRGLPRRLPETRRGAAPVQPGFLRI